jgi:hypothetical protein
MLYLFIKKVDKTDCSNYTRISLLQTKYNILSNILLSGLILKSEDIIGIHMVSLLISM